MGTKEWGEPMPSVLIQESLAELGITVNIEKVPSANFRSVLVEKSRPMIVNNFGGWLNYPDYFLLLRLSRSGCHLQRQLLQESRDG
jgi:peptide/nickel transport system substrate-binding protein